MKKLATVMMASVALLGSQIAYAHHPFPVPSTMTGTVEVEKGQRFNCDLTVTFDSNGYAYITLSPGDPRCSLLTVTPNPVPYSYNATTHEVTLNDVHATTVTLGNCVGDIIAEWDGDTEELLIDAVLPEEVPTTGDCTIEGIIS